LTSDSRLQTAEKRIDAIFDIEREINGKDAGTRTRLAARHERSRSLVEGLRSSLIAQRGKLSKHNGVAKAIDYFTTPKHGRWAAFAAFLDDGRNCLPNSAAERALREIALGRNYAHQVIVRSSPREAPERLTRQRFSARRTAHNSKVLKEPHQLVRGPIPAGARTNRLQPVESALLH